MLRADFTSLAKTVATQLKKTPKLHNLALCQFSAKDLQAVHESEGCNKREEMYIISSSRQIGSLYFWPGVQFFLCVHAVFIFRFSLPLHMFALAG